MFTKLDVYFHILHATFSISHFLNAKINSIGLNSVQEYILYTGQLFFFKDSTLIIYIVFNSLTFFLP